MSMGVSAGRQKGRVSSSLSEINVTPLVDVMLVLLIVFMVSAPLMQQGIQVDLPQADTGALNQVPDQLLLVVDRKKRISVNGQRIRKGTLIKRLAAMASVKPDIQVFVQADRRIDYGYVARVVAEVKKAKIHRVGLVTQPGSAKGAPL